MVLMAWKKGNSCMKKPSHAPTLLVQPSQRESVGSNTSWMECRPVSEKQAPQAFYKEGDAPAACLVNENGPAGGGPASSQVRKPHPPPTTTESCALTEESLSFGRAALLLFK